jgi:hypothetical protein
MRSIGISQAQRPAACRNPRRPARAMHLIDIENLAGLERPSQADASRVRASYRQLVAVGPMDQVVVACNHLAFQGAGFGWIDARHLVRSGADGADLELLAVIYFEDVARRFDRVVIGSGDGIFASAAAHLASEGCQVTAVSRRESLSARLRLAVHEVIYLDSIEPSTTAAVGPWHAA